jgi:hypothetical protein
LGADWGQRPRRFTLPSSIGDIETRGRLKQSAGKHCRRQCSNCPRWRKLFAAAVHESRLDCGVHRSLPSICLGATRTGVRQPKPDTVSKKPQSCSWSQTPRSPHARAGHNPFRKLSYLTYPQALRVRKQGILGSVRMFDGPYLNLNIRPQPFFYSGKTTNQARPHIFPKS